MNSEDFELMRDLLKTRSGLVITPDKVYLLESRLTPLARRSGLEGLDELVAKIRMEKNEKLIIEVVEAMTTNESFFFRDKNPFDAMENSILPALYKSRADRKHLRIWCAAASSGQEPYSIALIMKEKWEMWKDWRIEIIGTDISTKILDKARRGLYSQFEVQRGLPVQMMIKYFTQKGDLWELSEDIRSMVQYKELNLLKSFDGMGRFDVIFCRNVLIYFDTDNKASVLDRMYEHLAPDGSVFLGAAETVLGITDRFKPVRGLRGVYAPTDAEGNIAPAALSLTG